MEIMEISKKELNSLISQGYEILFYYSDEGEFAGYTCYDLKSPSGDIIRVIV